MADFTIDCPHCNQPLLIGPDLQGQTVACTHCGGHLVIPQIAAPVPLPSLVAFSPASGPPARTKPTVGKKSPFATIVGGALVLCLGAAIGLFCKIGLSPRNRSAADKSSFGPAAEDPPIKGVAADEPNVALAIKPKVALQPPRSLEALHQLDDGPSDFTHDEWVEIKKDLYHKGLLGHEVKDGVYEYRNDPRNYLGTIRATRQFIEGN